MTHIMKLNPSPFDMIASGKKTIELRLNDEKRRMIGCNDEIVFVNTQDSQKKIKVKVINIYRFKSFAQLYAELPLLKCGYTEEDVLTASAEDMLMYYSEEQQRKYGVLGIEIELKGE